MPKPIGEMTSEELKTKITGLEYDLGVEKERVKIARRDHECFVKQVAGILLTIAENQSIHLAKDDSEA